MAAQRTAEIISGLIWFVVSTVSLTLGVFWLIYEDQILMFFGDTPLQSLGILLVPLIDARIDVDLNTLDILGLLPSAYDFGAEIAILAGVFLAVLGYQMVARTPGARLVAAFSHIVLGLLVLLLTYLIWSTNIPWPSTIFRYITYGLFAIGVFSQGFLAWQLMKEDRDNTALGWNPYPVCVRCGRKLDNNKCPVHDADYFTIWLENDRTSQSHKSRSSQAGEPIYIGKRGNISLDVTKNKEYNGISQQHAIIYYDTDREAFFITDCGSTNGTKVAGETVQQDEWQRLPKGATIQLADISFTFQIQELSYKDHIRGLDDS